MHAKFLRSEINSRSAELTYIVAIILMHFMGTLLGTIRYIPTLLYMEVFSIIVGTTLSKPHINKLCGGGLFIRSYRAIILQDVVKNVHGLNFRRHWPCGWRAHTCTV